MEKTFTAKAEEWAVAQIELAKAERELEHAKAAVDRWDRTVRERKEALLKCVGQPNSTGANSRTERSAFLKDGRVVFVHANHGVRLLSPEE